MKLAVRVMGAAILAAAFGVLAGCTNYIQYPKPSVSSVSPSSVQAGGPSFILTVNGSNFVFGGQIIWNGTTLPTQYITSGQLQAQISPNLISTPGTIAIQTFNPPPGGGLSNSVNLTIGAAPSPIPAITSLQPSAAQAGGGNFNLIVNGSNFTPTSVVTWNGVNLPAAYVTSSEIGTTVSAVLIESPGFVNVAVLNQPPSGGLSNTVSFPVNNPSPVVTSISPLNSIADGPAVTLVVNGGGFTCAAFTTSNGSTTCTTSESEVEWNGTPVATTFLSNIQLTATVSTSQLNQAGTNAVTVFNPSPGGGTSSAANFQVIPGSSGQGLPSLVDVASDGTQAEFGIGNLGESGPAIGGGGRFVAFSSISQNLVSSTADTAGVANVFVRDTCLGISTGCTPQTVTASVANSGQPTNADALSPSLSSDGRYVVFSSTATNLASTATGGVSQIYLHDTCFGATSGCAPSTILLSFATDGVSAGNGASTESSISPDGQYVVFVSTATNLVSQATTGAPEIYLRSTCLGAATSCTPATTLVSLASNGALADGSSSTPVVSSGGRYVAFESSATNLAISSGGSQQVYWRDTCTGAPSGCVPTTALVSVASDGTSAGNGPSGSPAISSDGRYTVFSSQATNLVGTGFASGTPQQIYERDLCAGASGCVPTTALISIAKDGSSPADAAAANPSVDQSGRYVLFSSKASNLTSALPNGFTQIFARDTCIGASSCTPQTHLISVAADGTTLGNGDSLYPAITTQAHFATFLSFGNNLVIDDNEPTLEDIFLSVTGF